VGVAAVGVAALIVSVLVFNGGGSPSRSAPTTVPAPSTPTTVVPSTTPTSASPAATTVAVARDAEAAGVVVYVATSEGDVVRLDVGTGTLERRRDFVAGQNGSWLPVGRKGGYVVSSTADWRGGYGGYGGTVVGVGDDPASTPAVLDSPSDANAFRGTQVAAAAEPDEVWLWSQNPDLSTTVRRMRIDGVVTAGPVTLPGSLPNVLGADGPGAVALSGTGGMYRAEVTGTTVDIEPVWPRVPVDYNDWFLLDKTCTGSQDCRLELVDRASQQSRPVSQKPLEAPLLYGPPLEARLDWTALSPDGAWLAQPNDSGELALYDLLGDGPPISHPMLDGPLGPGPIGRPPPFAFSPDGRWLVFLGQSDTVELWPVGTPQPPVTITVPGLHDVTALSVAPA
jgi:hypothetical protein